MIEVGRREKQQGKVEGAVSISKQYLYNFSIIKEYNFRQRSVGLKAFKKVLDLFAR